MIEENLHFGGNKNINEFLDIKNIIKKNINIHSKKN